MNTDSKQVSLAKFENKEGTRWWEHRFGYEIYPRTFCDSNGDGIGDLKGIEGKLDYLKWLGIKAIWVCPFYPSPGIDCGYDVADYCDVDPEIGSLGDFDDLVKACHERDIAILIDIVPNHCSDQHQLFQKAIADPTCPERDLFIFRDPKPDGSPPNNWLSVFGGSAWELDEKSGQYYLHLFYPEQPDFNWRNVKVTKYFEEVIRFWLDRGIDGYRIDVTQGLFKSKELEDAVELIQLPADAPAELKFANLDSSCFYCLPETAKLFESWKRIAGEYGAVLIGEMIETTPDRLARYFSDEGLDLVMFLTSSRIAWEPEQIIEMFTKTERDFCHRITWMMSNHDGVRSVDRFGGGELGLKRTLALTAFSAMLSGFPFLYNGEELGWPNLEVQTEHIRDPRAIRFPENGREGRDPCRTNMAWTSQEQLQGFSNAQISWLVSPPRPDESCVSEQMQDPKSALQKYKEIVELREKYFEIACQDNTDKKWTNSKTSIVFECEDLIVGLNTSDKIYILNTDGDYILEYCSDSSAKRGATYSSSLEFAPESTCIFVRQ